MTDTKTESPDEVAERLLARAAEERRKSGQANGSSARGARRAKAEPRSN